MARLAHAYMLPRDFRRRRSRGLRWRRAGTRGLWLVWTGQGNVSGIQRTRGEGGSQGSGTREVISERSSCGGWVARTAHASSLRRRP